MKMQKNVKLKFLLAIFLPLLILTTIIGGGALALTRQHHGVAHAAGDLVCADQSTPDEYGMCADGTQAQPAPTDNGNNQNQPTNGDPQNSPQDGQAIDCGGGLQFTQNEIATIADQLPQYGYTADEVQGFKQDPCPLYQFTNAPDETYVASLPADNTIASSPSNTALTSFSAKSLLTTGAAMKCDKEIGIKAGHMHQQGFGWFRSSHLAVRATLKVNICFDGQNVTKVTPFPEAKPTAEGAAQGWACDTPTKIVADYLHPDPDHSVYKVTYRISCLMPSPGSVNGSGSGNVGSAPVSVTFGASKNIPQQPWQQTMSITIHGDGSAQIEGGQLCKGDPTNPQWDNCDNDSMPIETN